MLLSARMISVLWAGLGGFVGASLRYGVGAAMESWGARSGLGLATLAVNVTGCLAIGVLTQLVAARGILSPQISIFVLVGLLGGFTTFSTFGHETVELWQNRGAMLASLAAAAHVVLGIGAVWGGRLAAQRWWG